MICLFLFVCVFVFNNHKDTLEEFVFNPTWYRFQEFDTTYLDNTISQKHIQTNTKTVYDPPSMCELRMFIAIDI